MKVKANAKWMEIFCAYAINDTILNCEDLVVGDFEKERLPDIYNEAKTFGIEVVQLEKDRDLDIKYVLQACNENDGDYQKIQKYCDERYPKAYELNEKNGKITDFCTTSGCHAEDWMKDIYFKNLNKKLEKLNRGNYSGINGQISLCTSIIQRIKTEYDARLVLYEYFQAFKNYKKSFEKIIVVTSSQVLMFDLNKIKEINPITEHDIIHDFQIKGDDYLISCEYDFKKIHEITTRHFLK